VVDLLVPASAVFASGLVSRQPEGMILPEPIAFVVAAGIVLGFAPQLHSVSELHVKLSNVLRGLSLVFGVAPTRRYGSGCSSLTGREANVEVGE
jgi:hypothetical protein